MEEKDTSGISGEGPEGRLFDPETTGTISEGDVDSERELEEDQASVAGEIDAVPGGTSDQEEGSATPADPVEQDEGPEADQQEGSAADDSSRADGDPALGVDSGPNTEEIEIPETLIPSRSAPHVSEPSPVWMWWGWSMVLLFFLVMVVGVITGILGRAVILDVASFWPVFGVLGLAAFAVRSRFTYRIRAILPLLVASWLGVAIALHLSGWSVLPSAVGDMQGAEVGTLEVASLTLDIEGDLLVTTSNSDVLYMVSLLREGGPMSAPQALEISSPGALAIEVAPRNQSFWFSSSGWNVVLSDRVVWAVHVSAADVTVDLRSTATNGGSIAGSGVVEFGGAAAGNWDLDGDILLRVPESVGILVIGDAALPPGWSVSEFGRQSAATVELTLTVVEDATVEIVTY